MTTFESCAPERLAALGHFIEEAFFCALFGLGLLLSSHLRQQFLFFLRSIVFLRFLALVPFIRHNHLR